MRRDREERNGMAKEVEGDDGPGGSGCGMVRRKSGGGQPLDGIFDGYFPSLIGK